MRPKSTCSTVLKRIDKFLETIVILLLTLLFVLVVIPILAILVIVFNLNQQFAVISAKVFKRGRLVKVLSPVSSFLANTDDIYKAPRSILVSAVILEGVLDMQRIKEAIKVQILERIDPKTGKWMYPEFLQNISYWMGYPFWTKLDPEKINSEWFLKEYVRVHDNDENLESNFDMLEKLLRQLCFTPFCKEKPLGEMIILPNYTPHPEKNAGLSPDGKYFCIITRHHHALADVFAMRRIVQNLSTTDQVEYIQAHDYSAQGKLKSRSCFIRLFKSVLLIPRMLYEFTQSAVFLTINSSESTIWPTRTAPAMVSTNNYSNSSMSDVKRLRTFVTAHVKPFNMNEINAIKEIHGVSGTAVLFTAMIGAVRRTLYNRRGIVPPYILFGFPLPLPGHKGLLDNRTTIAMMQITFGEPDAIRRLHKMNKSIQKLKTSTLPASYAILYLALLGRIPHWILDLCFDRMTQKTEGVASSNIAGPKKLFDIAGYDVRDWFSGSGMSSKTRVPLLGMVSGGGRARLTVMSDSVVIASDEQAQLLGDNFFNELETLRQGLELSQCW